MSPEASQTALPTKPEPCRSVRRCRRRACCRARKGRAAPVRWFGAALASPALWVDAFSRLWKARLALQPVAGLEDPPHHGKADQEKQDGHGEAHPYAHIGHSEEAPAKAAHEIDHGVEQRHILPDGRQHADRIEGAAEEGKRGDD